MRNGGASNAAATTSNGPSKKSHRSLVTIFVTASCAFLLGRQTKTLELYTTDSMIDANMNSESFATDPSSTDSSSASSVSVVGVQHKLDDEDEADYIVRKSYLNSYAHILPCNNSTIERNCLLKTLQYFNPTTEQERRSLPSVPWWFQTLLRDVVRNGAYGFWHHFATTDPAIHFCSIEKVGTTEWRKVFCDLNEDECPNDGKKYPPHCVTGLVGRRCAFKTKKPMPMDAPLAVFLRDPLERLLSAFLDKCSKLAIRRNERHCEPNEVFNPDPNVDRKSLSLTTNIEESGKQLFAAYLDTMPLKWNVHFVPQAFMCDLYRTIHTQYAFVGDMGKEFMIDLERMANQFGGRLPTQLDKTFGYVEGVKAKKFNNTGKQNSHATHSPEKVAKYYTAATVRKGLELLSIDYVVLGLKVPEWARQMLRDETI